MASHDPSHNPQHVHRVVSLAQKILARETARAASVYDADVVHLAALLHDIGDRKYLSQVAAISASIQGRAAEEEEAVDPQRLVYCVLVAHGADEALAEKVQMIVSHVSYTTERAKPEEVGRLIREGYPELAIVQDADRLDAIGAVGIGRCFTFLGAKGKNFCPEGMWVMDNAIEHFEEKLVRLESMMKTETGREMARVRTARLKEFQEWWAVEMNDAA
ncbi:HD superfamily hydrolase [Aspergillus nomiae NRRL 13137]|uniref:HD superfamily hydrolase n=1 Tax=Aspergillus nomiae NRRL (strain ATCC 15546 / NRRL 13137 / CBS 260.88 / M93) TaxID=1509407 RepID=A0A0L1IQL5_ASPN3|nr:HD superfamily hydrolase [Aspergillus nomiae NRRL 13137]KNG81774.1 HD superfamily hydrolase [Aspergillus nomiae NRRL 13137]